MADYSQIISGIHGGTSSGHIVDEHGYIIIDPKTRQITLPVDFNSTIAYTGDINSQIVRFICPETYDGHSLKNCSNHEIRWYNTGSGIGDVSELKVGDTIEGSFILSWLIPPEATTKAGTLQCVISIYDQANYDVTGIHVESLEWVTKEDANTYSYDYPYGDTTNPIINLYNGTYTIEILGMNSRSDSIWYLGYRDDGYGEGETELIEGTTVSVHSITQGEYWDIRQDPYIYAETTYGGSGWIQFRIMGNSNTEPGVIKYQWNTAPFTSLSIGATLDNVDVKTPTKDKILTLNTQTRNITLPAGYNTTIATQGDVGTTFIYIQCPRYIAGMDLTSDKIKKYLGWSTGEFSGINSCSVEKIYSEVEKDDLVMLTWDVDENLTANYAGNFAFELSFKQFKEDGTTLEKQWYSNNNNSLSIKETLGIDGDTIPTSGDTGVFVEVVGITGINEAELDKMLREVLGG